MALTALIAALLAIASGCQSAPAGETGGELRVTVSQDAGDEPGEDTPDAARGGEGADVEPAEPETDAPPDLPVISPDDTGAGGPGEPVLEPVVPGEDDELPQINERRLAELRDVYPFTSPESGDSRDPAWHARQFLLALVDEDPDRLRRALHPLSPFGFDVDDRSGWSWCRARIGRHRGIAGWGFPDPAVGEVVCLLASVPDRADTTWIRMRPVGTPRGQSGWHVYQTGRTLDPNRLCPTSRMVFTRLDSTVARPTFTGDEAVTQRLLEQIPAVVANLIADVREQRADAAAQRLLESDEWLATSPPCLQPFAPEPGHADLLHARLSRACTAGLSHAGTVVLTRHQLRDSTSVWSQALVVFGRPDQLRHAWLTDWRSVHGIWRLAGIHPQPLPPEVEKLPGWSPAPDR